MKFMCATAVGVNNYPANPAQSQRTCLIFFLKTRLQQGERK
jgi:hypothetical protein